jgi:hypothetical protein
VWRVASSEAHPGRATARAQQRSRPPRSGPVGDGRSAAPTASVATAPASSLAASWRPRTTRTSARGRTPARARRGCAPEPTGRSAGCPRLRPLPPVARWGRRPRS